MIFLSDRIYRKYLILSLFCSSVSSRHLVAFLVVLQRQRYQFRQTSANFIWPNVLDSTHLHVSLLAPATKWIGVQRSWITESKMINDRWVHQRYLIWGLTQGRAHRINASSSLIVTVKMANDARTWIAKPCSQRICAHAKNYSILNTYWVKTESNMTAVCRFLQ